MVSLVWETMAPYIHLKSDVNGHPNKREGPEGRRVRMGWENVGDDLQETGNRS